MPKAAFYAVHRGRQPGVYTSWGECEAQIKGFSGAKFKKFTTRTEAESFARGETLKPTPLSAYWQTNTTIPDSKAVTEAPGSHDILHIYTDGSCLHNGTKRARAGVGVYFAEGDPRNLSRPLDKGERQTNNRGEMTAILEALSRTEPDLKAGSTLIIHTDSKYSMRVMGEYGRRCQRRGWRTAEGRTPPNLDLMQRGITWMDRFPRQIQFEHVHAHTGADDPHSRGNAAADALAVAGAERH